MEPSKKWVTGPLYKKRGRGIGLPNPFTPEVHITILIIIKEVKKKSTDEKDRSFKLIKKKGLNRNA